MAQNGLFSHDDEMIYQILTQRTPPPPFKEPYDTSMEISTSEAIPNRHKTKDPKVILDEVPESEI